MSEKSSSKSLSFWLQFLSLSALSLIPLILLRVIIDSPGPATHSQVVGSIFIIICLLGAVVGIRPSSFSRKGLQQEGQIVLDSSQEIETHTQRPTLRGHHHSCDQFSDHVLNIGPTVFCAGCTGLTTGAVLSIYGAFLYFFLGISLINEFLVFWIGFAGVFVGITQHHLYRALSVRSGFIRYILNVVFVLGAFFLLVGANQIVGYILVDVYILCVILLWIFNRIMMSSSEHERICKQCDIESCMHL
jgi:hypothetical protein